MTMLEKLKSVLKWRKPSSISAHTKYVMMTQEQHDKVFAERLKPWRDAAEAMGLDIGAFDASIAEKKAHLDDRLGDLRANYSVRNS